MLKRRLSLGVVSHRDEALRWVHHLDAEDRAMAKATLHDRLIAALLASDERFLPDAVTRRYTVLTCSHPNAPQGWHC